MKIWKSEIQFIHNNKVLQTIRIYPCYNILSNLQIFNALSLKKQKQQQWNNAIVLASNAGDLLLLIT